MPPTRTATECINIMPATAVNPICVTQMRRHGTSQTAAEPGFFDYYLV